MAESHNRTHILIFPFPAQGHMLPLLDFTHQLIIHNIANITIIITPKNLHSLNPLLSNHPSISTLVLPFPSHPSIPSGIENVKDLPKGDFRSVMCALGKLYDPILEWFHNHPSPPTAIISDMFLGFTHHLACQLGIHRYVFSPSGAFALSIIYSLWSDMPNVTPKGIKNTSDGDDDDEIFHFPNIPNHPKYPWWQISPIYRSYIEGDPDSEFLKEGFLANISSYGLVINTFTELESVYLDHLMKDLGHGRVWSVGPVLLQDDEEDNSSVPSQRGGEILSWLDTCDDNSVVYVCFGSQAVLTNRQMEELAKGLKRSGLKFIWSTKGHVSTDHGKIPYGFEDQVAGRGMVIRQWAPQVLILRHQAVGAFLTHCGWNSILEGLVAGVTMLAWPMGADQFVNANLIVDELKVAVRVCEGAKTVPNSEELVGFLAGVVGLEGKGAELKARVSELRKAALNGIKGGGSSFENLEEFIKHLGEEAAKIKR